MWATVLISCSIFYNGIDADSNSMEHVSAQKREVEVIQYRRLYKPLHIIPRRKVKPRYNKRVPKIEPLYYLAPPWDDLKNNLA